MNQITTIYSAWSPREIETAAKMWQTLYADHYGDERGPKGSQERTLQAIAERLGFFYQRVWGRYHAHGPSFNAGGRARNLSAQAVADREARRIAAESRSITASVFGDPPPGFSALDRRPR